MKRPVSAPEEPRKGVDFVHDGVSDFRIVVADSSSVSNRYAAEEFREFVRRMTGAGLEIVLDRPPTGDREILIGECNRLTGFLASVDASLLGPEGYVLRTSEKCLVIAGGGPRGVLYGVYDVLERFGCRWFTPDVSRIPRLDRLALPPLDEIRKPAFEYRDTYLWEACDGDWAARNRYNRNGRRGTLGPRHGGKPDWPPGLFAHTFERLVPAGRYYEKHPEYFSLVDGKRLKTKNQLCCTNLEVARIIADSVRKAFRENPATTIVSVSQNDWYNACECPECAALVEREGSPMAPVLLLVNRVAEMIEDEFPDKLVDTLSYQWTRKAPKTMKPRPNVVIRLCDIECCFVHPLDRCPSPLNRDFVRDLNDWSRIAERLWVWNYTTSFAHFLIPFPDLRTRAENIRLFAENGVTGVFQQDAYTTPNAEFSGLSGYLNARLMWDPSTDADATIREYLDSVYGPAAGPVGAYLAMINDTAFSDTLHMSVWQGPDGGWMTDDLLARADSLWNGAEHAAAADSAALDRVRIARLTTDYAVICRDRLRGGAYVIDQKKRRLEVNPAFTARVDRFCAVAEHAGVTLLSEVNITPKSFRAEIAKTVTARDVPLKEPVRPSNAAAGLSYRFFEGEWKQLPDFDALAPLRTGAVEGFALPFAGSGSEFAFVFDGVIDVPSDGVYTFWTRSDGFSSLAVADGETVRNGGNDPIRERCGYIGLKKGRHPLRLVYFTRECCMKLEVSWSGPGFEKRPVPAGILRCAPPPETAGGK